MRVRPVLSAAVLGGGLLCLGHPAGAALGDAVIVTDVVEYRCTTLATADTQDIRVRVTLTMPTDARPGEQFEIGWTGVYADGDELRAPFDGLPADTKAYAYAGISDKPGLTSATGVGTIDVAGGEATVPLPTERVPLKTQASTAGTATVRPAALNFGTTPQDRVIDCEVQNRAALTPYTLTIGSVSPSTTPSSTPSTTPSSTPSSSPSSTPISTVTETATETETATNPDGTVTRIPTGGAATGGGGETGPDARLLILTGLLLTATAAAGGLLLRRRNPSTRDSPIR
ncbi:hypothetical protein Misp01_08730 [Microtetraspora sp. NBRC 13810]|uniref:hypothetical protein n=1 Tax=Microtetraspora sp. NBRC 13810 TaxID=3030990 RepID=UPI0024A1CE1D|nr:hypothetical protein [Microtetraspora sp. NBRC 13810]GLW05743.1 hypothetical protein Misp01_08730 [Microtetraspora sp. NBRC 13810]